MLPAAAYSQTQLIVNGKAPRLKDGTEILLNQFVPDRFRPANKPHSTKVKNHRFKFVLKTNSAELYAISTNKGVYRTFLQPGTANITITDSSLKRVFVGGNPTAVEYDRFKAQFNKMDIYRTYGNARVDYYSYTHNENIDTAMLALKMRNMDSLKSLVQNEDLKVGMQWIEQHPRSLINTSVLYDQVTYMPQNEIKKVFYSLPKATRSNSWGRELKYRIDSLFIGSIAPNFSQPDASGREVSLKEFRGKYVLLDFWASWCVPCREENPYMVTIMQKFASKNFEIVGVSVDEKRNDWLKAIKDDGLHWTNLSDLLGRNSPVFLKYYVPGIPDNYLIDPNGKIIAKDLHGDYLITKLSELLKR